MNLTYKIPRLPIRWFLISILLLSLNGCVYLRLLEIKNQLAAFDKNFTVDTANGFVLHCLNPVLYNKDIIFLGSGEPTRKENIEDQEQWTFVFEKQSAPEKPVESGKDLIFQMRFNEHRKLIRVQISDIILHIVPAEFIQMSLRALGNATVEKSKRQVKVNSIEHSTPIPLPTRKTVIEGLGEPYGVQTLPESILLTYQYKLITPTPAEKLKNQGIAVVTLNFNPNNNKLTQVACRFVDLKLSINYQKLFNQ